MKIALVQPPYKNRVFETISMPLGLCWISSYLKKEFHAEVHGYDLLLSPKEETKLYEDLKFLNYDIIGIQAHSNMTMDYTMKIINTIKKISPQTLVIAGGNSATFMIEYLFKNSKIDLIIRGEGEVTFGEVIKNYKKRKYSKINGIAYSSEGEIVLTPERKQIENIDSIPLPDRDIFSHNEYPQVGLIMSRGCPFKCSFCSTSKYWKHKVRIRSAEKIIEEIKELKKNFKVNKLFILDDTFGFYKKETIDFLNKLIDSNLDIKWACTTRGDILDEEFLFLCKKAGCIEIHFGLDTANNKTQILINKKLDLNLLKKNCLYAKKIGIRTKLSIIIGLPQEGEKDIYNTFEYIKELFPNEIQIYPLMPYKGIDILKNDEINIRDTECSNWTQDALNPVIDSKNLTKEKISYISKKGAKLFQSMGYLWIPFDLPPQKRNELYIVKTVFAPLQSL